MEQMRIEKDSLGEVRLPARALYAAQTQRAIDNFPVSGQRMPESFIRALILIKDTAAVANQKLRTIDSEHATAIQSACRRLIDDQDLMQHFPVDVFQTGSGTSTNMNANEVIATLATRNSLVEIHPNDHVNYGQSSNDVIPTCIHVSAALAIHQLLLPQMQHLAKTIATKAYELKDVCKTGRTHLMDAMPIRFDQVLSGWQAQIEHNISHLEQLLPALQDLAQGGTAVGTGVNAHPQFARVFCQLLTQKTRIEFKPAANYFARISSQDTAVQLSGVLKTLAVSIMKIANDLRWMNSGPLAGLGEITLEALQPGSSIMPGKVNPVIPESAAMAAAQVIGNDVAITVGGQSGNFELNVMLPMIAYNLLHSITLLGNTCGLLADKAIATFTVNTDQINEPLRKNPVLVTALNPIIGYSKAAAIAKQAYQEKRPVLDVAMEQTELSQEQLESLLDPVGLTRIDQ